MTTIHSYTILHYGQEYLNYALQSVEGVINKSYVFYTPHPSHGFRTDVPPIESKEQLQEMIKNRHKVKWYDVSGLYDEGPHRDLALETVINEGADLILVLDYDEIWDEGTLIDVLDFVWTENKARDWLINFTHLWKSFDYCCKDNLWPVRIIDTRHKEGTGYVPVELGDIYHFGYCIGNDVMRYKWEIHGHHSELRQNWFEEKYQNWEWGINDVHPANEDNWWVPEKFDKTKLPVIMRNHPRYNGD